VPLSRTAINVLLMYFCAASGVILQLALVRMQSHLTTCSNTCHRTASVTDLTTARSAPTSSSAHRLNVSHIIS